MEAHHFLQSLGKTMTALQLRNELRRIDVDANGMMVSGIHTIMTNIIYIVTHSYQCDDDDVVCHVSCYVLCYMWKGFT